MRCPISLNGFTGRINPAVGRRGTGLGLAIARLLTQLMGGTILAENHPSGGAIFRTTISQSLNYRNWFTHLWLVL